MNTRILSSFLALFSATVLVARTLSAAVVPAPGYAVHTISTPNSVQGGVVRQGGTIVVGQGSFGGGTEQIIRLDGAGTTVIATGFNPLGGFDLDTTGTLYVVDNCQECAGAATGDTLFAIPAALTRTTAVTAVGNEVVPAGTIPFAQDALVIPGGAVLVSDAAGPGAGRVVRVQGGVASNFLTGFDYTGGLALKPDNTLLVGNVDASFQGSVFKFALDATPLGTLVGGLSGAYDQVVDNDGNVLVSGGFTPDFSSSTMVAVAADGSVTERAHGFSFSAEMFFDTVRDEALVLDFGVSEITAICRDRDGDGLCDADDPCTGAATVDQPKLTITKLATPPGDDKLAFKGQMMLPFPFSPALDPGSRGARVLLEGTAGALLDVTIPGGAFDPTTHTGWRANTAGTAWTYKSPTGVLGIRKVQVKTVPTQPGLVRFAVAGKNGSYPVAPSDLPLRATMVLDALSGECGEASFTAPMPTCAFDATGNTLRCG